MKKEMKKRNEILLCTEAFKSVTEVNLRSVLLWVLYRFQIGFFVFGARKNDQLCVSYNLPFKWLNAGVVDKYLTTSMA